MTVRINEIDRGHGAVWIAARGEMADRTRAFSWDRTPVGPPHTWPSSLRTIINVMLSSQHPMFLWWGPQLVQFYNDGYRPSLGDDRHPLALGANGREFWAEIWPAIGPQIEAVMTRGESTWNVDHLVPIARNRRIEEVYWTYGYSPVFDDDGKVGGTLVIVQETTARVINERRMAMLQRLADQTHTESQAAVQMCTHSAALLAEYNADFAFALLYLFDGTGRTLQRVAQVGSLPDSAAPATVSLSQGASEGTAATDAAGVNAGAGSEAQTTVWPFGQVVCSGQPALVSDLRSLVGHVPGGRWDEPADHALVLPILGAGGAGPQSVVGVLVAGLSPRLPCDDTYRDFLRSVAGQLGNMITRVQVHEHEQAAREQLERLFEQAPAAIALLRGPDHVYTLANQRYLALVGRDNVLGMPVVDVFPELAGQGIIELLHRVYTTGEPFVGTALPLRLGRRGDGTLDTVYFNFVYAPMYDRGGGITGIFVHAYDVTDQVTARQAAELASRAREEFLSIASHELRNPVAGLKGTAQLLRRIQRSGRLDDARLDRYLTAIEVGSDRLAALTEDLLDVSRLQHGDLPLRLRLTDLVALTHEVNARLPEQVRQRVRTELPDVTVPIMLDPDRIEQIVVNLLDNASKYAPPDSEIVLTLTQDAEGATVTVQDHGIGLPAGAIERIFQPFGRAPNAQAANIPGLGLGLYICRQIARQHGGRLWAASPGEGQGTTVYLELPQQPPAAREADGA